MALVFAFECFVCDAATLTEIEPVGTFRVSVLATTQNPNNIIAYRRLDEDDTSYYQDFLIDGQYFGGNPSIQSRSVYDPLESDAMRRFAPFFTSLTYPASYETSNYVIKGVNSSGYYFITSPLNVTSSGSSDFYTDEDVKIGNGDIASIFNPSTGIGLCSTIFTDGELSYPLDPDNDYYVARFQSNRYKDGYKFSGGEKTFVVTFLNGLEEEEQEDPYEEGGTSGTGGGTGNFDGTSDAISIPSLPTLSAVDTGFITLFNPTISQLGNLASYMWSSAFDLDNFRKLFADPMEAILGMSIVPVAVPSAGAAAVKVGNISTGVSMTKAASQYVSVDCGTINVHEYWGAYLDYAPYTECQIYLPYCGTHPVNTDDVMNNSVHVVYHVDILSGACCAYVQCGQSVMYEFVGQCSVSVPITGNNWTNMINGALSIAASIGSMVATGGASAPLAAAGLAQTAVNSFKPSVEKSGSMGGMGGMLGVQVPYLILTRPRQALPENQKHFTGYPSFVTRTMSALSGYTEIAEVHLENMTATSGEIAEIEQLLKGGVIF